MMQDDFKEREPEIYEIPFEIILGENDIELLRDYVHCFSIYFGHVVAYQRYDLMEKELKKRTANLDIVEEARNSSAEKALLIGNYCGILALMKETLQAHQVLQSEVVLKAAKLKLELKPMHDILQYLIQQPNATAETIAAQTGQAIEKTRDLISSMIEMSLIIGDEVDHKIVYSMTQTGQLYASRGFDESRMYLFAAEETLKKVIEMWNME